MINNSVGRGNELINSKIHQSSHVDSYDHMRNSINSGENFYRDKNDRINMAHEELKIAPVEVVTVTSHEDIVKPMFR